MAGVAACAASVQTPWITVEEEPSPGLTNHITGLEDLLQDMQLKVDSSPDLGPGLWFWSWSVVLVDGQVCGSGPGVQFWSCSRYVILVSGGSVGIVVPGVKLWSVIQVSPGL